MVDGAARGNPGPAGCGAFIHDARGLVSRKLYRYLGIATNNVAEYEGLLMGLEGALALGAEKIRVESDSELMVNQLNGVYRVRDEKLKKLYQRASDLLGQFDSYCITHVKREQNQVADRLANEAIDRALAHAKSGGKAKASKIYALP
jgi:ribonuclease HI